MPLGSKVNLDPKHAAFANCAFSANDTAHHFDQPLGHDQADASSLFGVRLLTQAIERLKKLRQFLWRSIPLRYP